MATKEEMREATRARMIAVGLEVFGKQGFKDGSLAEIVSAAGVTTGAAYHHFGDKKGLFRAVAEHVEQQILDYVLSKLDPGDIDISSLERGVELTLEYCAKPNIQRIVFRDAPTVFGHREWREIEVNYAFGLMTNTLRAMSSEGRVDVGNPEMTARIILGTVIELAHVVADARSKKKALNEAKPILRSVIRSLLQEKAQ